MKPTRLMVALGAFLAALTSHAYFREAFQTYNYGSPPGAPWYTLEDASPAGIADVDCCQTPAKSLYIAQNTGVGRPIGPLTAGKWMFRFCWIPQTALNAGSGTVGNAGASVGVRTLPGGLIATTGITPAPAAWAHGTGWADVVILIDLNADTASVYYNGTLRGSGSIAAGLTLAEIQFGTSNNVGNQIFVDNVSVVKDRDVCLQRGINDNFAPGNDFTYRGTGLVGTFRDFDDPTVIDRHFATTFLSACFRPCFGVPLATLQWRMKALTGNAVTDRISLGTFPTYPWTRAFSTFVGGWPNFTGVTTTIDLHQLPGGGNILPTINQTGRLDVSSSAWSTFDYFRLCFKPGKCWWGHLVYNLIGDAAYELPLSGGLPFDPTGPTSSGGVMFDLGEACGGLIDFSDSVDAARVGGALTSRVYDPEGREVGKVSVTGSGSTATVRGDFAVAGPTTLRTYYLNGNGQVVMSQVTPNNTGIGVARPGSGVIIDSITWRTRKCVGVSNCFTTWSTITFTAPMTVSGYGDVKSVVIERVAPFTSSWEKPIGSMTAEEPAPNARVVNLAWTYFDHALILGDGNAALNSFDKGMLVTADSPNGVTAMTARWGQAQASEVGIDTTANVRRNGAYYELEERGVQAVADVQIGKLRWTDVLSTYNILCEFPGFGGTLRVELRLNGSTVRVQNGTPAALGNVNVTPMGITHEVSPTHRFKVKLKGAAVVNVVGAPATLADEIWIQPFGAGPAAMYKTQTFLRHSGLDELMIGDVTTVRKLRCSVVMNGWVGSYAGMPVVATVTDPISGVVLETTNTTLDAVGSFTLLTGQRGPFALAVKTPKGLRKLQFAPQADVELSMVFSCHSGDLNNDNETNSDDFDILVVNFGTSGPAGDLTGDDQSDSDDYDVLIANFGLVGDPLF
ncbi:MAG TPA: hypothetical protein PLH94_12735 [Fimbriimonadaceae bacterium]|nr:hypothetical protein [Fimbriimonadaceae bacterium]